MAGPTKKARKPAQAEPDEEYASDESGSYHGQQEIQATFEGRNPEGHDFHGIKQLLNQLFLSAHIDLSQMSDMLIAQVGVGSVLKQSYNDSDDEDDTEMVEESDVFGITSVINLTSHKETPCVQEFYKFVTEECTKHADASTQLNFNQILTSCNRLGFIINERFVNIPSKISAAMLSSLVDEISRIKKKDDTYNFEYYLMICKIWKPKSGNNDESMLSNDEEQLFINKADFSFQFSVANKSDTGLTGNWQSEDKEFVPYRSVILFKADKLDCIVNEVKIYVQA